MRNKTKQDVPTIILTPTLRTSKKWKVLFNELVDLQNSAHHAHQDILTITGFMKTLEELEAHVKRNRR
jgi:hypothetical protein